MTTSDMSRGGVVLAMPPAHRAAVLVGTPSLIATVAFVLFGLVRWLVELARGDLGPPFAGLADRPWRIAVGVAAWFVIGLIGTWKSVSELAKVTVTLADIRVDRPDGTQTVSRADVAAVFLDGGRLVLLDRESRQLVREPLRAPVSAVAGAFREYGYPWQDR
jgi:hypothetical protein